MTDDALKSFTVLVVDDEEFSLRLVARVLGSLGVENVVTAKDGSEALEILKAGDRAIHLVISDIEMPVMNGFELARKVRYGVAPKYKDVPFLMLTGRDTEDNVRKGRIHRIDGFVVKPPKAEVLKSFVVKALGLS